jgi:putative FmdB family regulatory protein
VPVYAFSCGDCGSFEVVRPMAEASRRASCPDCGEAARRVYTPPGLTHIAAPLRRALDGEEKSAHEPAVVSQKQGRPMPHGHSHAPSPPWTFGH